ncbi:helix-turn-helix transcriptional regulator [Thermoactinomyces sp. CICC 10521]|uniref:helix-turn-helix transcriptional regulator n=1 Tax=Thermoactinomyces sp. CICC 10521 TaxID=2767426 RepID=UPI0021045BCD|nr:helix-turn-helix domain-containing protein [Thermoactinomyces sp. CICC 10521]
MRHNLIKARKAKGLTQRELADMIGIRETSVSNWEVERSLPRLEVAREVSKVLGFPIEFLFFEEEPSDGHRTLS